MNRWWSEQPNERYWLEATDREDIGADLRAPELDESGKENWRYSLFKDAQVGDIVLHYDKRSDANGIVAWSVVAGSTAEAPIIWGARGTYARERGIKPHERPGFIIPLTGFERLSKPITLEQIRSHEAELRALVAALERQYGKPLYFPFELSEKRPVRLLQGYGFKLPEAFLKLFPSLVSITHEVDGAASETDNAFQRNPPWTRDELILALELYMRSPASPPGKTSVEVQELSATLNKLGAALGFGENSKFRNANGVYMKMMNFRRFDPEYTASGKVGLTRGNKDEERVWREFAHDKDRLVKVANAIRQAIIVSRSEDVEELEDDGVVEADEGRLLTRLHRTRERSRKLVEQRKLKALKEHGRLCCETCSFDFEERYGTRGKGFIEAHHTKPVETLVEGSKTKLEDLALLCANCHRMVHSTRPWLSIAELRELIQRGANAPAHQ